ncbi:TetR/AcrR family transcriptional regulator [Aerococcus urinae]|uniref:TetR family transcriptional regulator C-terminal domain-containing protein n=1 Tax=Aerococcus urinae TaxID=1376 RepID=A0A0X8FFW4_9LACT|nr:TetR-like C-terminal domain-containing protein [Aerococcus urinae]AMB96522.1 hypothetical protein AWM73_08385 [Aerococcus urinae]MCY3032103.1 TetR family transcriptional regulator C-terminal domain-containing protein [Aerococcus urinae]MCY3037609.1 TetR family transcriptional regulator C-terminal domain-containing protein [Aerococcus urinae]MCY3044149.1 TetR family transcriptional regulator C-terminal domain-containing protein [Aerococcus urinae]MCY3045725.1 TetR family transcriptional regu
MPLAKDKIITAYYDLVVESRSPDISVDQIIKKSGTSRSTFYRNFLDKYDVMNQVFLVDYKKDKPQTIDQVSPFIDSVIKTLEQKSDYYQLILTVSNTNDFYNYLYHFIYNWFKQAFSKQTKPPFQNTDINFVSRYTASAITYTITQWLKNDQNLPGSQLSKSLYDSLPLHLLKETSNV